MTNLFGFRTDEFSSIGASLASICGIFATISPRKTASPIQRLNTSGLQNSIFKFEDNKSLACSSNSLSLNIQCAPLGASTIHLSASATLTGRIALGTCQTWTKDPVSSSNSGIFSATPRHRKPTISTTLTACVNLTPRR